jgi:CRISPR-associated protein Cas6
MQVEAAFPLSGDQLPADSLYLLYSALSRRVPEFHQPGDPIRFGPIGGAVAGKGLVELTQTSRLRVRLPPERMGWIMPLAGETLRVGVHAVRLGFPTIRPLLPVPTLVARIVTFKNAQDPGRFILVARERLQQLDIAAEPGIPIFEEGPRTGELRRKVLRIKERRVIGYALQVTGLTAEESIRLQENGLGGRCRMGCGFFVPYLPR